MNLEALFNETPVLCFCTSPGSTKSASITQTGTLAIFSNAIKSAFGISAYRRSVALSRHSAQAVIVELPSCICENRKAIVKELIHLKTG